MEGIKMLDEKCKKNRRQHAGILELTNDIARVVHEIRAAMILQLN
jgi:hypothetical protein